MQGSEKKEGFSLKHLLLLAATVFVGGGTIILWIMFIKGGALAISNLHEEGILTFFKISAGLLLPVILLVTNLIGFMWLLHCKASLKKIFLFALVGMTVFLLYYPAVFLVIKIFK